MSEVDTTAANATENVNTTEPAAEAKAEAPVEQPQAQDNGLGLTTEQTEQFKKFLDANGGFSTAFSKLKQDVTGRNTDKKEEPTSQPEQTTEPKAEQPQAPQPEPTKPADGYISPQDFAIKQYFKAVAGEEKYAAIAKDIESGAILKEMAGLGIKATDDNGNYNDAMIHKFLDLKAATVPATPSVVEPTTTPTVTFTEIDGDITSFADAQKIITESMKGRATGTGEHPKLAEAKKFMKEYYGNKR